MSPEADSAALRCIQQCYQTPQISALWVTVSSRNDLKLFAKNYPNFSSKMLDMEVTLWEDLKHAVSSEAVNVAFASMQ